MFRLPSLLRAALLCCLPLWAEAGHPLPPATSTGDLEQRLSKILKAHKVPGMSVAFASRQEAPWMTGLGLADVAGNRPANADTLFRVGSISKMFVGLAALKLVEEGRLDLNAPVRSLVPEVAFQNPWEATDPVRVVHLLEHTTGWDDLHLKEYAHNDPTPATLAQGLTVGPESRTSRWRPGTRFAYCNSGPAVAAAIIEKLTGQRFEDYIQAAFFTPIGMPTADYLLSPRAQRLLTSLYRADGRTPFPYWHIVLRPAGSLNASARDMGAFLRFLLDGGTAGGARLLTEAFLRRMETPTTSWGAQGGVACGYGLHNYTMLDDRGFVWQGHQGGVEGGLSELCYLPGQGLGYFFSINAGSGEAFKAIRDELRAFATRTLPAPALPLPVAVPEATARAFQGWYRGASPRDQLTAFLERLNLAHASIAGDRLMFRPWLGKGVTYRSVDGRHFRREQQGAARMVLMDTPEGRALVDSGTVFLRLSPLRAWLELALTAFVLLALVSVPLFALVWGSRWAFGRLRNAPNLRVRIWPLLSELILVATLGLVVVVGDDAIQRLGHRTAWSIGLMLCTWAFALSTVLGLWSALRVDRRGMNRWAYLHSLGAALALAFLAIYFAWFGLIGLRTWA